MDCSRLGHLNRDGVYNLAARLIDDCVHIALHETPRDNVPTQLDVALTWAVMCGRDPYEAACGILGRLVEIERQEQAEAERRRTENREYKRLARYTQGNTCPVCDKAITNTARTCQKHRERK